MKINKETKIHRIDALTLRKALRKNQPSQHTLKGFSLLLGVSVKKTAAIMRGLEADGLVIKEPTYGTWENTIEGNAFANATAGRMVSRATAERILAELIQRAKTINADPKYARKVTRITVFGSYLSDAPQVSDVDVYIELGPRHSDPQVQAATEAAAKRRIPSTGSMVEDIYRTEREVTKLLKAGSTSLQIAQSIPDGATQKVVFEERR